MSSAICFNMDQSKILSSCNWLNQIHTDSIYNKGYKNNKYIFFNKTELFIKKNKPTYFVL